MVGCRDCVLCRRVEVKELKLRPNIDVHDYQVRFRAAQKFLEKVWHHASSSRVNAEQTGLESPAATPCSFLI
jgi:Translation initiation factor IF-3, C-terminal domain